MVVICGDGAVGRDAVLEGVALRGVAVVRRGQYHGRLIRLRVLMVEVDYTSTAVRGGRLAVEEEKEEETWYEERDGTDKKYNTRRKNNQADSKT